MRRCWKAVIAAQSTGPIWTAIIRTTLTVIPVCRRDPSRTQASMRCVPQPIRPIPRRSISSRGPTGRAVTHSRTIWRPTTPLRRDIAVARNKSIKQELREYLDAERPDSITGAVWQGLLERFAPVSDSYLRDLLRQTGLPFEQPYAGVRQHTFEELEQSLRELLTVYTEACTTGNRD